MAGHSNGQAASFTRKECKFFNELPDFVANLLQT
jgi:hypothetical protein